MYRNQQKARENVNSLVPSTNNGLMILDAIVDKTQVGLFPLGVIYKGTYSGKPVYIREIREDIDGAVLDNITDCVALNNCLLDSTFILPVLGICQGRMIVTEAPVHGPLREYQAHIHPRQKVVIARKIADAIMYMHDIGDEDNRVIHRDIRAANILLDDGPEGLEPKITGFEMCKVGRITGKEPNIDDSYKKWWSPERIDEYGTNPCSDVYAFGVLMYEISTGEEPESSDPVEMVKVERKRICGEFSNLMERCLDSRFGRRPTMQTILDELMDIEVRWDPAKEP
ncbi:hypothetical protein BGX28_001716 [Mortierella sp. GBA30]|nr:hypothetical protein BGX28_001716 [Mortierella sp. GBA30]